jgi:hypothetical protein
MGFSDVFMGFLSFFFVFFYYEISIFSCFKKKKKSSVLYIFKKVYFRFLIFNIKINKKFQKFRNSIFYR